MNKRSWKTRVSALTMAFLLPVAGCSSSTAVDDEAPVEAEEESVDEAAQEVALDSEVLPVGDSPILGDPEAPVTVMEFSSMQCPFCARAGEVTQELVERYDGEVRVVFKYFPLPNQPQAEPASRMLEATRRQDEDAFWDMKSALFAHLGEFGTQPMEELGAKLGKDLGLDEEQLRQDYHDPEIAAIVERDLEMGRQLGVNGTPQFFVNGEVISGAYPVEEFSVVVDEQLEFVDELLEEGVDEEEVYDKAVERNLGVQGAP